jgi:hypothetical protein
MLHHAFTGKVSPDTAVNTVYSSLVCGVKRFMQRNTRAGLAKFFNSPAKFFDEIFICAGQNFSCHFTRFYV